MAAVCLMQENVWLQRQRFEEAEAHYYAVQAGTAQPGARGQGDAKGDAGSLRNEISKARKDIQNALKQPGGSAGAADPAVQKRLSSLEKENKDLKKVTDDLRALVLRLESRVATLEGGKGSAPAANPAPKPAPPPADDDDDDDDDLFGSDDEDEEELKRIKEERLAAYAAKKAKKPALIAKSIITLDIKPWDDETDMKEMERLVRTVECDGLVWASKAALKPVGYGIMKLQIGCVVEDDKVGTDFLEEEITKFEDHVQSVDVVSFNKV